MKQNKCLEFLFSLYSRYKSKQFKKVGKDSIIDFPLYTYGEKKIELGQSVHIERGNRIEAVYKFEGMNYHPSISIGNCVYISPNCHIGAINSIIIEDYVLIGSGCLIIDHSHGRSTQKELTIPPNKRPLYSKGPIHIEKNVWIGEHAVILPGVRVGEGAVIGANSVVTKDVPAKSVVAGNPAKVIK